MQEPGSTEWAAQAKWSATWPYHGTMPTETPHRALAEIFQRDTKQRRILRERLSVLASFVSAQQLYSELQAAGGKIGRATVYRTLQAMAKAGEVDVVWTDEGEVLYRKCGPCHHHHLVCRQCSTAVEIEGPGVERWAMEAGADHGFTDVKHVVELFGLCAKCSGAAD
jgi:Fur family ferric uptake transcriptional regulator